MKFPNYKGLSQETSVKLAKARLDAIEREKLKENRAELVGNVHFMQQQTSFSAVKTFGRYASADPTLDLIDEDTAAAVKAHAKLEDPFGNSAAITSPFDANYISIPMDDLEGKTAYYHGYYRPFEYRRWMEWGLFDPPIAHIKIPIWYRSYRINSPGVSGTDKNAFIYYASHADFNVPTGAFSHAIWFKPTTIAGGVPGPFSFLQWRYQNATNWYAVVHETASPNHVLIFVNEAGTITKRETNLSIVFNEWNLVFWRYDATTNALFFKHNDVQDSITPSDTLTVPYTTDTNMYLGGIPLDINLRCEGWLGLYVMWNVILNSTQMSSMWNNGTIAP